MADEWTDVEDIQMGKRWLRKGSTVWVRGRKGAFTVIRIQVRDDLINVEVIPRNGHSSVIRATQLTKIRG